MRREGHCVLNIVLALLIFVSSYARDTSFVGSNSIRFSHENHGPNLKTLAGGKFLHDEARLPGIKVAARQELLNYATKEGLNVLQKRVQGISIPRATKTFNLPLVGKFTLQLSNIQVLGLNVSSEDAKTDILDGNFDLWATQVGARLGFDWHWEKLGISGTGKGELILGGGSILYRFHVTKQPDGEQPALIVDDASSRFSSLDLFITAYSADWLYQAVMVLFKDNIQRAVQNGISEALRKDVPAAINTVLGTLPTQLDIKGLPFSTSFQYSVFTLTYVLVEGYGEIDRPGPSSWPRSLLRAHRRLQAMQEQCPFEATPFPLSRDAVGADTHMLSVYVHESVINCMLWGLYKAAVLQYSITDGSIPKLHLTTDLLVMLIPELPKAYPHQSLRIDVAAMDQPMVKFSVDSGITVKAKYATTIFVSNETLNDPKIVTLEADLTIVGKLSWDMTIIESVAVKHTVREATLAVNPATWDMTVAWFIQNYAGLYPVCFLVSRFVHTPVASMVELVSAESQNYDDWFSLSSDVAVHGLTASRGSV